MSDRHEKKTESNIHAPYRPPTFSDDAPAYIDVQAYPSPLPRIGQKESPLYTPPRFDAPIDTQSARYTPPAFDAQPARYTPPSYSDMPTRPLYTPPVFDDAPKYAPSPIKRQLETDDPLIDVQEPSNSTTQDTDLPSGTGITAHSTFEKKERRKKDRRKQEAKTTASVRRSRRDRSPASRWLSVTALICVIVFFAAATVRILFLPTDETIYVFDGTQAEYIITDDYIPPATMPVISNVAWDGSDALALLETSTLIGVGDAILLEQASTPGPTNLSCTVRVYMTSTGTVEEMDLEEYLVGVVAAEVPASYNMEAIKAQAVAARTYTVRRMANLGGVGDGKGGDVCTSPAHCQAYYSQEDLQKRWGSNFEKYYRIVCEAVYGTRGLVLTYDGKPINAFYHASSGGRTANCEDVFTQALPYLRAVDSPGESAYSGFSTTKTMSRSEFASVLSNKTGTAIAPEDLESMVEVTDRRDGRIYRIKIAGETYKGTTFQNWFSLRTTNVQISMDADNVTMTVYGYGHGVGMSQTGANAMASAGNSYATILKHYYTGVELEPYM